jgi:hypothetical protein
MAYQHVLNPERNKERPELMKGIQPAREQIERRISRTYVWGHVFGWGSVLCFVAAGAWLAYNLR